MRTRSLAQPWSGQQAFNAASKHEATFTVDGQSAGAAIEVHGGPLTFLRVFEAGHMYVSRTPRRRRAPRARPARRPLTRARRAPGAALRVPMDQPRHAQEMLRRFVAGEPLAAAA